MAFSGKNKALGELSVSSVRRLLKERGILARYRPPAAVAYPEWTRKHDRIQIFGIEYVGLIYNKERVKPADVPRQYQDLVHPKWKGKIVMANPTAVSEQ